MNQDIPILQATNLSKQYRDKNALKNLNLQIQPGEIFCLLGQNGAGKTTAINLFLGFISPSGGSVKVNGLEVQQHATETKKHLAYIPEQVMLYANLSGLENLRFFSRLAGFDYSSEVLRRLL